MAALTLTGGRATFTKDDDSEATAASMADEVGAPTVPVSLQTLVIPQTDFRKLISLGSLVRFTGLPTAGAFSGIPDRRRYQKPDSTTHDASIRADSVGT